MEDAQLELNIATWKARSRVNGPGERFVLWLQGCHLHCPGCVNADFQPLEPRTQLSIAAVAERIRSCPGLAGVTYSGGEPMLQAHALALLSESLQAVGLTVVCYTGYLLEDLQARQVPWIDRLLAATDILIDGPYLQEQATRALRWRGSGNQRIHFLSDTYRPLAESIDSHAADMEFSVNVDGFTTTGTWPQGFLERLTEIMKNE